MNVSINFINFAQESFILGGMTLAVLVLLGIMGICPVLAYFPHGEALRWPVYAPVTGLALLTALGLPLSLMGLPVDRWALIFACLGGILGITAVLHCLRSTQGRRLLFSYFRIRYLVVTAVFLVPVLLATYIITGSHSGHVRDIWGSGDFGAYWIVADFLQNNGATIDSYTSQNLYYASDIQDHLSKHARLGCMVSLAFLGRILSPGNIQHMIIPFIVTMIILTIGLVQRWLEYERLGNRWLLLLLLCYPFLYFLLYFTYLSQSTGVVLFLAGLLLVSGTHTAVPGQKKISHIIGSGILVGVAILHYPSILLALLICTIVLFVTETYNGTQRYSVMWLAIALLVCSYYLPQTIHELILVMSSSQLPGWNWNGIIGSFEFLGLRSVLGYNLPVTCSTRLKLLDIIVSIGMFVSLLYGVWLSRLRVASLTVVITTCIITTTAFLKYMQNIPNASHAFVKGISTFAICLILVIMIPFGQLLKRQKGNHKFVIASIVSILILGQFLSVSYGAWQRPWFTDDLIKLSRRQLERGYFLRFYPDLFWQMRDPVVRDSRRALQEGSRIKEPLLILMDKRRLLLYNGLQIVDSEGTYVAVRREAIQ